MFRSARRPIQPLFVRRDNGFRWRGTDTSRIESLSDAVFAFAITLLVVSLEVPKRYAELQRMMQGFFGFALCFLMLLLIWYAQYIYFRRYSLDDLTSFVLNAALLFVVAFYIYPLKFLFTLLVNRLTGYQPVDASGAVIRVIQVGDWRELMLIYSAGFVGVYVIFTLLYRHAYRLREQLELNELEVHITRGALYENMLMVSIGLLSLLLAWRGYPAHSGLVYALIGPVQTILGFTYKSRAPAVMSDAA